MGLLIILTLVKIFSSQVHCFDSTAKMISPCGHPKETAPAPPLGKVHRQLQKLHQKFSALVDWARIAGEWGGDETQLSLCPINFEAGATHLDTKQTSNCFSPWAKTRLSLHSSR